MRILHVISNLDPRAGGTTAALVAMAEAQQRAGLDVHVASMFAEGFASDAVDRLRSAGVNVTLIGPYTSFLARHPSIKPELTGLINTADVVHIHALWEEIQHQAAVIARRMNKPYLITPHGMLDPWSLSQSALKKRLYLMWRLRKNLNRAAALHFTDESERDLTAALKLEAPTIVEPLIIDLSEFQPAPPHGAFRARFDLSDRPIALFMSRVHPKKGLDLLIPAFASIAGSTDALLVVAGPDSDGYLATVEQMARERGIADRVRFVGMVRGRARAEALVDATVFVLPSYQENFGIVVIESLAVGTPVIISDQVAVHRRITQAGAGEVVLTNVEALAAALRRWLTDTDLRRRGAEAAVRMVADQFDPQRQAARWIEHHQRLVTP